MALGRFDKASGLFSHIVENAPMIEEAACIWQNVTSSCPTRMLRSVFWRRLAKTITVITSLICLQHAHTS